MPTDTATPVLRRMLKPAPNTVSGAAITEARAWRMSLPRASEQAAGLVANVAGLEMSETDLDEVLAEWEAFSLTLAISGADASRGLVLVDAELRSALIEVQTLGQVMRQAVPARPATPVDAALVGHVIDAWIAGFEDAGRASGGWRTGELVADQREAKMAVDDGEYRVQDVTILLGEGARTGRLRIVTPFATAASAGETAPREDRSVLNEVEADLHAVLHRTTVPYRWLATLEPGALLEVPVEALGAVRVEDSDGRLVAVAKLGKSQGQRAVRLLDETPEDAGASGPTPFRTVAAGAVSGLPEAAGEPDAVPAPVGLSREDLPAADALPPLDMTIAD